MKRAVDSGLKEGYRLRLLGTLAATLTLLIAAVRMWPPPDEHDRGPSQMSARQEAIQIEEMRPTRQQSNQPPPPVAPLPPVIVADDVILEQGELDLSDRLPAIETSGTMSRSTDDIDAVTSFEGPRPIRVVEPEYTRAAHRRRVRAEVVVGVRIDERGRVEEAWVLKRFLLGGDDEPRREVEELGFGLEEAAMSAAQRCLFRPARRNGVAVASETTLGFGFGV